MAVLLADVEGFSYKEIADIMDVPIGTVMSRLHRGRRALEKALHDFGVARGLVAAPSRAGHIGWSWHDGREGRHEHQLPWKRCTAFTTSSTAN